MDNQPQNEKWPQAKEQLQKEYPHLTEEDLAYELGKEEELLERLQMKTGKTKKEINDWLRIMG